MKSVLISGASSGIGAALAIRLAAPGTRLGLIGRNEERLARVIADCEKRGAVCRPGLLDVTDRAAAAAYCAAFEAESPLDILISNAGVLAGRTEAGAIEDAGTAHRVIDTNLAAAVDMVNFVVPGMRARGVGKIVLVSSLAAFSPLADAPAYSAAKAGLVAYGLALRRALVREGIQVVVSCPGYVDTAMGRMHIGSRPFETTADAAACKIIEAFERNRPLSGFPFPLYWSARLLQLVPEAIGRMATNGLRFHVAKDET